MENHFTLSFRNYLVQTTEYPIHTLAQLIAKVEASKATLTTLARLGNNHKNETSTWP